MCQSQSKERIEKGGVRMKRYDDRCGSCKERLRDCHLARSGEGVQATPCESTQVGVVFCETERCHRASRSLRLGSLLGKDVATVGTRRRPAPTSPRKAVSTREQERPRGHQSFARGLPERGDSFGAHQVRAPAHPRRAPSPTLRMALHTDPHASMPSCAKTRPFRNRPQISSLDALGIRAESRVFRAAGLTSDPWAGG